MSTCFSPIEKKIIALPNVFVLQIYFIYRFLMLYVVIRFVNQCFTTSLIAECMWTGKQLISHVYIYCR